MRRNTLVFVTVCFGFLYAVTSVLGHYSFAAEYDRNKPVKFTGFISKNGSNHVNGRSVTLPDGKKVFGGSADDGGTGAR
jgi:hypothetical protein